jgi:hypothetical protein
VYESLRRSNSPDDSYILLGDDIVISGTEPSTCYKEIIESLGMEINLTKTLISKTSFEFAKRFFINGDEWSPLPIGQLKHAKSQYWDIVGFIEQCEDRG